MAKGEDFFKLIQHDHGGEQTIARTPEIEVHAVKIFPQRFAFGRPRPGDLGAIEFGGNREGDLPAQGRGVVRVIQTHAEGQIVELFESRKKAGLKQRGLAQSRLAVKHDDRRTLHQTQQFGRLTFPAKKEIAIALTERA